MADNTATIKIQVDTSGVKPGAVAAKNDIEATLKATNATVPITPMGPKGGVLTEAQQAVGAANWRAADAAQAAINAKVAMDAAKQAEKLAPGGLRGATASIKALTGGATQFLGTIVGIISKVTLLGAAASAVFGGIWYLLDTGNRKAAAFRESVRASTEELAKFKTELPKMTDTSVGGSEEPEARAVRLADAMDGLNKKYDEEWEKVYRNKTLIGKARDEAFALIKKRREDETADVQRAIRDNDSTLKSKGVNSANDARNKRVKDAMDAEKLLQAQTEDAELEGIAKISAAERRSLNELYKQRDASDDQQVTDSVNRQIELTKRKYAADRREFFKTEAEKNKAIKESAASEAKAREDAARAIANELKGIFKAAAGDPFGGSRVDYSSQIPGMLRQIQQSLVQLNRRA